MKKRIITISREFGSGGRFIGEEAAKKLGIAYYDKNIINEIAEKSGLSPEYVQESAELSPKKGLFAYAFAGRDITGKSIEDIVYEAQRKVILELADGESCVIIGRNADYILKLSLIHIFSVVADEDCEIIFLNVQKLLVTCPTACGHHQKLIRNLVSVLANKILLLNDKITHVCKRTTRDKLLSYLSAESIRHSSLSFDIPFDRQQLADYLCIDRAAMSTEISKLQKEGFIKTNRNHFELTVSDDADSHIPERKRSCGQTDYV